MEDLKNYGHATVGVGTPDQRKIPIQDYVSCFFADKRQVNISSLVNNEGCIIEIKNPKTTNRSSQTMWLTEESLMSFMAGISIYLKCKGISFDEVLKKLSENGEVQYTFSDNLSIIQI